MTFTYSQLYLFTLKRLYAPIFKMKLTLLIMCCYFSTSLGLPFKHARQASDPGNLDNFIYPEWAITNFDGGCSPGGCILTFNMSSPATASEPAITASCNVDGDELDWQQCASTPSDPSQAEDEEKGAVWARSFDATDKFKVSIQHRFANASLTPTRVYNVTGNLTVHFEEVPLPANFTVMGTSVSEAWWWLKVRSLEDGGEETGCAGQGHHVCEPVRNADGSIKGFMQLESEQRLLESE